MARGARGRLVILAGKAKDGPDGNELAPDEHVVVLGYSRLLWCRFSPRQDMATLIDGLEEAFLYFGGIPQELLFDQMIEGLHAPQDPEPTSRRRRARQEATTS